VLKLEKVDKIIEASIYVYANQKGMKLKTNSVAHYGGSVAYSLVFSIDALHLYLYVT
jgi:hypothetical protein